MHKDNCIFCKIAAGEIPSHKIYEDDFFIAFLDISPSSPGHTLLIPKTHADDIFALPDEIASRIFPVLSKLSVNIKQKLDLNGLNILQNNGESAGQTVFHLHVHLIPRYENDDVKIGWYPQAVSPETLKELAEKLKI